MADETTAPTPPPLDVEGINMFCKKLAGNKRALPSGTGIAAWFSTAGTLLNEYLPTILQVLQSLATATGTKPTIAQFFEKGAEMFQVSPEHQVVTQPVRDLSDPAGA
jgi:hypothetical protein